MKNHLRTVLAAVFAMIGVVAFAHSGLAFARLVPGGSLDRAKSSTLQFRSLTAARAAGYGLLKDKNGIVCIADSMPGMTMGAMGVHYAKSSLVGDGKLDVTTPEALVYEPVAGGKLRLAALEYVVLKAAWDAHHTSDPSLFGHRFNETYGGNRFGLPAFYSLHVWLYKTNPSGEFAMWNPRVHCPVSR
jgi:hypothetical protein